MPQDQDKDSDWGIILETELDVDRFMMALREIDDFLRARDFPHKGAVSHQIDKTRFREAGQRNEAWIFSVAEDEDAAVHTRSGQNLLSKHAIESTISGRSAACFEDRSCDINLFLNAKVDVVGCVPIRNTTHDIVQCGSSRPTQYERADVLPLIECQFYGEAFPCPNQPQKLVEKYYNDSFLRRHYAADFEPNGTSLECLQKNGYPSFLVCPEGPDADGGNIYKTKGSLGQNGEKCGRLAPEVSRTYISGSMPTRNIQKLAGLQGFLDSKAMPTRKERFKQLKKHKKR